MPKLLKLLLAPVLLPPLLLAMGVLVAFGYSFRRKDEDEELLRQARDAALHQQHEEDGEHDDSMRRWFADFSPYERCQAIGRMANRGGATVVPAENIVDWYRRRHPNSPYAR